MEYRDSPKNMKDIGAELSVGTILEGGVQKVGDRVRINAQLIEVDTDRHLWAETFDRELTAENVFDLQSEIARKIVSAIAIQLSPEEEALLDDVPTQSLAAYEAYLRAREIFYGANYTRSSERNALPLLETAIELDPDYADAHALLSIIYGQDYWRGIQTSPEFLETYRATIDRALELKPGSPLALRAQANYYYRVENDYRRTLELIQSALASAPGDVDLHADKALALRRLGRFEESVASFRRALEIDPANRFYLTIMLETMAMFGQWQDIVDSTVSLEDADPNDIDSQFVRGQALMNLNGDLEPLRRVLQHMNLIASNQYLSYSAYIPMLDRDPDGMLMVLNNAIWQEAVADTFDNSLIHILLTADAWRFKGDQEKAREFYQAIVDKRDEVERHSDQVYLFSALTLAVALARLERFDEANHLIAEIAEKYQIEDDAVIWNNIPCASALVRGLAGDRITAWDLHFDPNWDFMRDDPRFVELATPDNLIQ
jgi:tetratricopeptide (TPR) repeat protein